MSLTTRIVSLRFLHVASRGAEWTVTARCEGEGSTWTSRSRPGVAGDLMMVTDLDAAERAPDALHRCAATGRGGT